MDNTLQLNPITIRIIMYQKNSNFLRLYTDKLLDYCWNFLNATFFFMYGFHYTLLQ